MSFSKQTPNYGLPQWVGTDSPQFLTDVNEAFKKIDDQMKVNSEGGEDVSNELRQLSQEITNAQGEIAGLQADLSAVTQTANDAKADAAAALRQVGEVGTELGEWYTYSVLIKDVNPIAEGLLNVNRNVLARIDCKFHAPTRMLIVNSDIDANRAPEVTANGMYTATIKTNVDGIGNFFPLYRLPIKTSSTNAAERGGYFQYELSSTKYTFGNDTISGIGFPVVARRPSPISGLDQIETLLNSNNAGAPNVSFAESYLRHASIGSYGGYLWLGIHGTSNKEKICKNAGFGQQIYQLNQFLNLELESTWTPTTP